MKKIKIKKTNKSLLGLTILFIFLDLFAIAGFVMMYGPWDGIKQLYINTAMKTKDHKYLADLFYSKETIKKVMASNYFISIEEDVDLDAIVIDTSEKETYDNEYDREILTRDEGNDDYKIIPIKVGISKGYLVAIYDPTKVSLIRTPQFNKSSVMYNEPIPKMCKRYGGLVCINGGGFEDPTGTGSNIPRGYVIDDEEILWPLKNHSKTKGNIIGFNSDGKLLLLSNSTGTEALEKGMVDGLEFGPFLIVNGKPLEIVGDPWGRSPRVGIAQRKDGVVLFLVIDGENYINGATLKNMVDVFVKYGAYNAANLDGGHSTTLAVNGKLYNNPPAAAKKIGGRWVVTGFGLIP